LNHGSSYFRRTKRLRSKYEVSEGLDCIGEMVAHGAIWNPGDQSGFNSLRGALYGCEPDVTIELLQVFVKHQACPKERLVELLRQPRMKEHLVSQTYWLTRLGLKYEDKRNTKQQLPPASLLCQYNRQELYEKVWSEPALKVAKTIRLLGCKTGEGVQSTLGACSR
jgi:hypothetical protein